MKGIYFLVISVDHNIKIKAGKTNTFFIKKGIYTYIGSGTGEFGGGELLNRVIRHLRFRKKNHWHIDYLLNSNYTKIRAIGLIETLKISECDLVNKILKSMKNQPIFNFGSSDCKKGCPSHLIKIN